MNNKIFFGFKEVKPQKKQPLVNEVFSNVAKNYDIMNDVMSGGIHRIWKNKFIDNINAKPGDHLLDVAGGTGDISFRFLKKYPESKVTISDINSEMLDEGKKRAIDQGIIKNIDWEIANAEKLPFKDNSFDFYTISFGIRNVPDIDKALKEAYRVLKPGGKFLCLEFSHINNEFIKKFYDFYSFNIIPQMGQMIASDKDSYQYLVESIRKFPKQEDFKNMITNAGFKNVKYENLTFGISSIHSGWKI